MRWHTLRACAKASDGVLIYALTPPSLGCWLPSYRPEFCQYNVALFDDFYVCASGHWVAIRGKECVEI